MIQISCPSCGKKLKLADNLAGKRGRCPQCRSPITVPDSDDRGIDFEAISAMLPDTPTPPRARTVYRPAATTRRSSSAASKKSSSRPAASKKKLLGQLAIIIIASPIVAILIARSANPPGRSRAERENESTSAQPRGSEIATDFERYARDSMQQRARDAEQGYNAAQDWIAKRPEGTTVSNNWRATYVSSTASLNTGDPSYDAVGTLTWDLIKPTGTERQSDNFRRNRSTGRWEQVFKGVTPRPITDFATAHQSFRKFAPAFLEKIIPALNADQVYKIYLKGTRTSDAWFEVTEGSSGPEAKLCFNVNGDYAMVDAKLMFVTFFKIDGSDWSFVGGRFGYETRWQDIPAGATFLTATRDANNPFNRMGNTASVQDRTK